MKKFVVGICIFLVCVLVLGLGAKTIFKQERNSDNLIKVDDNYVETQNTYRGVNVRVAEDGTIKLFGKATSDYVLDVATVILEPGKYTLSGLDNPDLNMCYLELMYGEEHVVANTDIAVVEVTETTECLVRIIWNEGMEFSKYDFMTFFEVQPVLVKGETAGSFYK